MGDQMHEMELIATHETGAEEWHCPLCDRRFLLQWPPSYRKIVLNPGDEYVQHSCSKGGLVLGAPSFTTYDANLLPGDIDAQDFGDALPDAGDSAQAEADDRLEPWMKWLKNADLDSHLDSSS